jgi:hypothetical protein
VARKVHGKDNGLVNIARAGVTDKSEKNFVAIVSGGCTLGCLRACREDAGA